ncbi:MAG: bifunctional folylpolyglutamate synthase/dihydrofolate synthase [Anaerolineaceae bacterium]|jgi:dihydrofolate synthase/folylpolyglutamate synthase
MDSLDSKYQDTLDYLYSFIDFSMKRHVDDTHRFFKLDRMLKMTTLMGNPEQKFPSVHIAGTKGKGSTASFISHALYEAGYKVGIYTSPHLVEFTERIQINFEQISPADIVRITDLMRPYIEQIKEITTFELTTALAFQYFAEKEIDIAVLEVGLGGRLDATNVITPEVAVITSISYDHTTVLGNTLTEIAFEKGGIIKPKQPVVVAPQQMEAARELEKIALERQSPLVSVSRDYSFESVSHTHKTQTIVVEEKKPSHKNHIASQPLELKLPLLGFHQVQNAVTAVAALEVLRQQGWHISRTSVKQGFKSVIWPTRFEILRDNPPIVLDSAHNGDSMEHLKNTLDEYYPGVDFLFVFGASGDKELEAMLHAILPRVSQVITTQSIHPRAKGAEELRRIVEPFGVPVLACSPAEAAMSKSLEMAGESKGILVSGSMFIASAARVIFKQYGIY